MTRPSTAELALLRTRPHRTQLYLSIYQPPVALACQVNDVAIAKGDYLITYNNVTEGDFTDVESGMTVLVGSVAGGADLGQVRVRSATATVVTLAENSDIDWKDDVFLTVLKYWRIWPVYYRQTLAGDVVTYYKDYDVGYDNQTRAERLGTVICMGPHHAGLIDHTTGLHEVYYSSSGTVNVGGEYLGSGTYNFEWQFEGGTPTGSLSREPGIVAYDTPGHYTTSLRVSRNPTGTYSNDVSYRHVSVYDHPDHGEVNPISSWNMEVLTGNRDTGGYNATIWIEDDVPQETVVDGALVVVFADDFYGDTNQSIGGNALNREQIVFVGYVQRGGIEFSYADSVYRIEVASASIEADKHRGFSLALKSVTEANGWYELEDLTVLRSLHHYLKWHSTVLLCTDFELTAPDDANEYFDPDAQSIYSAINTFMESSMLGSVVSDRQGKLWAERGLSYQSGATGSYLGMEVTKSDWMNAPTIDEAIYPEVSQVQLGGIAYSGAGTGTFSAFLSEAPGIAPTYSGAPEDLKGLILTDQDQLNDLCGRYYAFRNSRYPSVGMPFAGNYRNLDIAPQETLLLSIASEDTPRNLVWDMKPFQVRSVDWKYGAEKGLFYPEAELSEVTAGVAGETVIIPDLPPSSGYNIPRFSVPPVALNFFIYGFSEVAVGATVFLCSASDGHTTATGTVDWAGDSGCGAQDIDFDTNNFFDADNGDHFTVYEPGIYYVSAAMAFDMLAADLAVNDVVSIEIFLRHMRGASVVRRAAGAVSGPMFRLAAGAPEISYAVARTGAMFVIEANDEIYVDWAHVGPAQHTFDMDESTGGGRSSWFSILKVGNA